MAGNRKRMASGGGSPYADGGCELWAARSDDEGTIGRVVGGLRQTVTAAGSAEEVSEWWARVVTRQSDAAAGHRGPRVAAGGGWVDRLKRKKMEEEERVAKEKKERKR